MFADSLYDTPWDNRSHRGWTTLISFALQALLVACLLAIPLVFPRTVPQLLRHEEITLPAARLEPPPASTSARHFVKPQSNMLGTALVAPQSIPDKIQDVHEGSPPAQVDLSGVVGATGVRTGGNSQISQIVGDFSTAAVPPPAPVVHSIRLSRMSEGSLIHQVQPEYPPIAKSAGIQGIVVLQAVIGRDGGIEHLQVVSGHPVLVPAAVRAVEQWRYRPYILNGEAVEVQTQITVKFILGR
ncbi:MAG TPA: energy transducer TonB [Terriglobales bacterium]|nr:energy transducer TonB [Terriglobales bacterium]